MIDLIKLFSQIKWAEKGGVVDLREEDYKSGWAFLGDDTPTVQDFNFVQQMNDKKDQWLYNQINEVLKSEGLTATEDELDTLLKAIKQMAKGYSNPKTIDGTTENKQETDGHTHSIASANTAQKGIVQLTEDLTSDSTELGLAARAGKRLKDLIDALTSNLGNYIPNSKKSNAVDSPSADTVATSAAVKIANDNANGRVSKLGDFIQWLTIQRDHAWLTVKSTNKNSAGIDMTVWNGNVAQSSIETVDIGGYATEQRFHNTPPGGNYNTDRRQHVMTIANDGNIWTKAYGWLHDKFLLAQTFWEFRNRFSYRVLNGVKGSSRYFTIPVGANVGLKISVGHINIDGIGERLHLDESFGHFLIGVGADRGSDRVPVGIEIVNDKQIIIHTGRPASVSYLLVGEFYY